MKVILLGPPGAGKGTQAARVSDKLGVTRVSSGDLFREHQRNDTELGRLARSYMETGALVPDEVTIKMVMEWIREPQQAQGFVIDGFPRTLTQAEALDTELANTDGIDKALHIYVPDEELIRRLTGRLICRQCQTPYHTRFSPPAESGECDKCDGELYQRADDMPEAVIKRIEVYANETKPLVQYYKEKGKLVEINGEGSIEEVGQALIEAIS
ncbi:MAG: adenylate kinase [Chloroflexi bacterium]|nr:adenylate kinase [Chloroflexota bacterium]